MTVQDADRHDPRAQACITVCTCVRGGSRGEMPTVCCLQTGLVPWSPRACVCVHVRVPRERAWACMCPVDGALEATATSPFRLLRDVVSNTKVCESRGGAGVQGRPPGGQGEATAATAGAEPGEGPRGGYQAAEPIRGPNATLGRACADLGRPPAEAQHDVRYQTYVWPPGVHVGVHACMRRRVRVTLTGWSPNCQGHRRQTLGQNLQDSRSPVGPESGGKGATGGGAVRGLGTD